ncbi:soluble cytochrome b562 [Arsukibacterium tuosuense]|uniref:Soluble cytochrome b562 n=1 Tax=Arsukibacterium tuosuense TaxID=1323745 RepID=A0A285IBI5_9GAMM|nr:cytochrome b562 [Arsukibacterium tuosuense]SNY45332.1 soluble cytochrome b562 [Arsukibacterium tuosuense]
MLNRFLFCLLLVLSLPVVAGNSVDLETTMKNMGLALKQAREAASPQAAKPFIGELTKLTEQAKTARFPEDKAQTYLEGLDKVLLTLQRARIAADAGDEQQLQQALTEVDKLRRHYHKQRKVSFWQLLFG